MVSIFERASLCDILKRIEIRTAMKRGACREGVSRLLS